VRDNLNWNAIIKTMCLAELATEFIKIALSIVVKNFPKS